MLIGGRELFCGGDVEGGGSNNCFCFLTAAVIVKNVCKTSGIFITCLETIHLNSMCLTGKDSSCWLIAGGLLVGWLVHCLFSSGQVLTF